MQLSWVWPIWTSQLEETSFYRASVRLYDFGDDVYTGLQAIVSIVESRHQFMLCQASAARNSSLNTL